MRLERLACAGLLLACAAFVGWVRLLPLSLAGVEKESRDAATLRRLQEERRYTGADGREYVYLGDLDSYLWLRQARTFLRRGTTCAEVVDGECRDLFTHAPVGRRDRYAGSPHAVAIAALQRLITLVNPGHPLPASAFLVPVLVGMLGTLPAFYLGLRLGGILGALAAALLVGLDPVFLTRSIGADNDVWNVVLPLFMVWAAVEALAATTWSLRLGLAGLAAAVATLHAAIWSGWGFAYLVLLGGLGGSIASQAARLWRGRPAARARLATSAGVALAFLVVSLAGTSLLGRATAAWSLPAQALQSVTRVFGDAPPAPIEEVRWPDAFASVGELARPNLSQVAQQVGGLALLVSAWAGTVAVALPRRWRWWHLAILAAASAVAAMVIDANLGNGPLLAIAAAQIAVAILLLARDDSGEGAGGPETTRPPPAGLIVCVWFLGALFMSRDGARFILLLVAPAGLATAMLLGRLHLFADSLAARRLARWPGAMRAGRIALFALLACCLISPVRRGVATAREYVPQMNDAWWQALSDLQASSPADAIVHTSWDRGYWAAYASERRVSADGGSLLTHLPYWFSRALMAPEARQSAGILRMLDCASDALPEAEGEHGAFAKLVRYGIDPLQVPDAISAMAALEPPEAAAWLAARNLDAAASDDVLASTHCRPPAAYLVLSTAMIRQASWRRMGTWDFGRAFAAAEARRLSADEASRRVAQRLDIDIGAAAALVEEARALRSDDAVDDFISAPSTYVLPDWFPCEASQDKRLLECRIPANARRLARLVYDAEDPAETRVFTQLQPGRQSEETPAVVVVAGGRDRSVDELESPSLPNVGVLVDVEKSRALLASPALVRSTFTQLVFLDGRTQSDFEKVGEQESVDGERVATWRVRWPGAR